MNSVYKSDISSPFQFWTVDDVSTWLTSIRFRQYIHAFREHQVCGRSLPMMTESDLNSIGVSSIGDRKAILYEITQLPNWLGYSFRLEHPDTNNVIEVYVSISQTFTTCIISVVFCPTADAKDSLHIKWAFFPKSLGEASKFGTGSSYSPVTNTRSIIRLPCPCDNVEIADVEYGNKAN